MSTILPSNLRQTIHELLYLLRRGHFRSRDRDDDPTIRPVVTENPVLHGNFTALSYNRTGLVGHLSFAFRE